MDSFPQKSPLSNALTVPTMYNPKTPQIFQKTPDNRDVSSRRNPLSNKSLRSQRLHFLKYFKIICSKTPDYASIHVREVMFMPRGPRVIPECGIFHIIIRGNNKRRIFYKDCEFRYFKKLLLRYKRKFEFLLYHYSLMKNHPHLCIHATKKTDISKMMQGLQLAYWHYYKKRYKYVGHVFQGRYKSNIIENENYLFNAGLYIEENSAKAGIVEDPIDYPWSSYPYYAAGKKDPLVDPSPLYEYFGANPEERQLKYVEFMQSRLAESRERKSCNG